MAEADESDGTFLMLFPTIAVVTNVDMEHLDFYKDMEDIKKAFLAFMNKVPFFGLVILCIDSENLASLMLMLKRRYVPPAFRRRRSYGRSTCARTVSARASPCFTRASGSET